MPLYQKKPKRCKHQWIDRDCHTPAYFHDSGNRCSRCGVRRKWYNFGHSASYRDLWSSDGDAPHYCECTYGSDVFSSPCCTGKMPFPEDRNREEEFQ